MTPDRLVRVTVDDRTGEFERGTTILQAASSLGIHIPTLCWHPKVSILGSCRVCLVEIEGFNRLMAACHTPVSDGMVVRTTTPLVRKVRRTVLELLLAKHPPDCLACDKGGWCELQEFTFRYGPEINRFPISRKEYVPVDASPFIERDTRKCVLCRRCIRVCREVRGVSVWGAMYRGYDKKIATFGEQPLDREFHDPFNCEFCGSCVDICPVGALTAKPSKHRSRPWEVDRTETSCPFCSVGCRVTAHHRPGELVKTTPVATPGGDFLDLCFRGRFATSYVNDPGRLTAPLLRVDGRLAEVSPERAAAFLAERFAGAGRGVELFAGTAATCEETWDVASRFARLAPTARAVAIDSRGEAEEGHFWPSRLLHTLPVDRLAGSGKLLVIGQDFTPTHPVAGIRLRQSIAAGGRMLLIDPFDTLLGRHAAWWLRPPTLAVEPLLELLAEALGGHDPGTIVSEEMARLAGLAAADWAPMLDWLSGEGRVTLVVQKLPGGIHHRVKRPLAALAAALAGVGTEVTYLPLDVNGAGVPVVLGAAGFRSEEEALEGILASRDEVGLAFFLRCDPLGDSWRRTEWLEHRRRSGCWVAADAFLTATAREADLVLPLAHFTAIDGTLHGAGGVGSFRPLEKAGPGPVPLPMFLAGLDAGGEPGFASPGDWGPTLRELGISALGRAAGHHQGGRRRTSLPFAPPREGELLLSLRFHRFPGHRLALAGARSILGPLDCLELHPVEARGRGLTDGAAVRIVPRRGTPFTLQLRVTPRVPPGQAAVVFDPEGAAATRVLDNATNAGHEWGGIPVTLEEG